MSEVYLALIPARAGSKSLLKKNLRTVGGKSLIERAVSSLIKNPQIREIFVSTDCEETKQLSNHLNVSVLDRRADSASDTSTAKDVVFDFCEHVKTQYDFQGVNLIYVQPTSPLRTSKHIFEAIQLYTREKSKNSILVSVCEPNFHPEKLLEEDENKNLKIFLNNSDSFFGNRQNLRRYFSPNGAIYIFNLGDFVENGQFPCEKFIGYEMDELSSIDIDNLDDLNLAEIIHENYPST